MKKKRIFPVAFVFAVALAMLFTACSDPDDPNNNDDPIDTDSIVTIMNLSLLVPAPIVGAEPRVTFTNAQFTGSVVWRVEGGETVIGNFDFDTVYQAVVTLTANESWTFEGFTGSFTHTGAAQIITTNNNDNAVVTILFNKTPSPATVTLLNLTSQVTAPAIGEEPVVTPIDTAQYTGEVEWFDEDDNAVDGVFQESITYKAVVTLTAKPGFSFTGILSNRFTYTDAASVINSAGSGVVTITFNMLISGITYPVISGIQACCFYPNFDITGLIAGLDSYEWAEWDTRCWHYVLTGADSTDPNYMSSSWYDEMYGPSVIDNVSNFGRRGTDFDNLYGTQYNIFWGLESWYGHVYALQEHFEFPSFAPNSYTSHFFTLDLGSVKEIATFEYHSHPFVATLSPFIAGQVYISDEPIGVDPRDPDILLAATFNFTGLPTIPTTEQTVPAGTVLPPHDQWTRVNITAPPGGLPVSGSGETVSGRYVQVRFTVLYNPGNNIAYPNHLTGHVNQFRIGIVE